MAYLAQSGFLGTGATSTADFTLLAYLLVILPAMLAGYAFARRRQFEPQHKLVMTGITLANWLLITVAMAGTYADGIAPQVPENLGVIDVLLPTVHLLVGGGAQLLATYLVARMWLEKQLPAWAKIRNIKTPMRLTLAGWLLTALMGVGIYVVFYVGTGTTSAGDGPAPVVTEEAGDEAAPVVTEEAG